jgi:Tfp pilus assembly protein PilE
MGQQQLLIVILVTILIGIATIVAINTFDNSRVQTNHEAVRQIMIDASGHAQAYFRQSTLMGGGGNSFQNVTLEDIQVQADHEHGTFSITETNIDSFTLSAEPAAGEGPIVSVIYRDRIEFVDPEE